MVNNKVSLLWQLELNSLSRNPENPAQGSHIQRIFDVRHVLERVWFAKQAAEGSLDV